jgi:DUF1365 family protein
LNEWHFPIAPQRLLRSTAAEADEDTSAYMLRLLFDNVLPFTTVISQIAGILIVFFILALLNVIPNATRNFRGTVLHARRKNGDACKLHKFSYDISMDMVDLDDPPSKRCHYFPAFVSFDRSKYMKGCSSLKRTLLRRLQKSTEDEQTYSVYLLTNLAVLGHTFNPISVYYVFRQNMLVNIVAEVTNIPWHEQTTYVLDIDNDQISNRVHEKKLHVSPFNPHNGQLYEFDFSNVPTAASCAASMQALHLCIRVYDGHTRARDAVMTVSYSLTASRFRLLRVFRPALTIIRIHFQALKLWARRFIVYEHPLRRTRQSEVAKSCIV